LVGNVTPPIVYANYDYLAKIRNSVDRVSNLRIVTTAKDAAGQTRVMEALEARFQEAGIPVARLETGAQVIQQQTSTTDIFVYFLLVMAVLIAVVGGLGLMGTMSMNVMERTREIGVMRSIGASDHSIQRMVIVEGVLVGVVSWVLGGLLAQPISVLLCAQVGNALMQNPLDYTFSLSGLSIWLVAVSLISAFATLFPARKATQLTIREVLAYE
jgi:putative ABC transport system permease protein